MNYIDYANRVSDQEKEESLVDFIAMLHLVEDDPSTAWETIKFLIERYEEADYYAIAEETEAHRVIGLLSAGPLEDLLSAHGPTFIDEAEQFASKDRRWAWALGGTWQCKMSEEIWRRVQQAADNTWWERRAAK